MKNELDRVWQGTLIALASFSEGNLVEQLKSAALLSPVAYLSHMKTALGDLAAKAFLGEVIFFKKPNFNLLATSGEFSDTESSISKN